jgi:hypothetical protein
LREPTRRELAVMSGHQYAVRRVKCSPHAENVAGALYKLMNPVGPIA